MVYIMAIITNVSAKQWVRTKGYIWISNENKSLHADTTNV
jgi:hypothetical protein